MAGLYRRCIVYFCFYVMICSVAAENDDARQEDDAQYETTTNVNTDVSLSEGIYTSTSENPNSEMMNSASVKKDDLLSTSLPMPGNSRPRNAVPTPGRKRQLSGQSQQDSDDQYRSAPEGSEETGQGENLEDVQQGGNLEDIQQRGNLEDIQQRGSLVGTQHRDSLEDIQQKDNPEETGQRHTLEVTRQNSNLTDNEVSPNKTMQEIIDSPNAENTTLIGGNILNLESISPAITTLQTTEGFTRKRWPPRPIQPPKNSGADMHAEKMESRANPCSKPVWLMCLLGLCRWTF